MTQPHPPGWYPDPQRKELARYWDGQQWTDQTREANPEEKRRNRRVVAVLGVLLVAFVIFMIVQNTSDDDDPAPAAQPSTTTATTPVAEETTTTTAETMAKAPANCRTAPDQITAIISSSFNDSGLSLGPAYSVSAPGGLTYVGANIMRGDERESSADVWVEKDGAVFALSGSAREYSLLPDGRRITDASAGDEYGIAVQDCTTGR